MITVLIISKIRIAVQFCKSIYVIPAVQFKEIDQIQVVVDNIHQPALRIIYFYPSREIYSLFYQVQRLGKRYLHIEFEFEVMIRNLERHVLRFRVEDLLQIRVEDIVGFVSIE